MIHTLPSPKTKKPRTQVGRGGGSGHGGHTTGRGHKGQKSRTGYTRPRPGFEGGQMPLSRRIPKLHGFSRGFVKGGVKRFCLHLTDVAENIEGNKVNTTSLLQAGLLRSMSKKVMIKILFDKEIDKKLVVEGIEVSKAAKAAIERAGGEVK